MSQRTAVTENISYEIEECQFCGQDVAVDDVPDDIMEETGHVVLVGEGTVVHQSENNGNWDEEFRFEFDEDASTHPNVEGHILCMACSKKIHNFDRDAETFTGEVPDLLMPEEDTMSEAAVGAILFAAAIVVILFFSLLLVV